MCGMLWMDGRERWGGEVGLDAIHTLGPHILFLHMRENNIDSTLHMSNLYTNITFLKM